MWASTRGAPPVVVVTWKRSGAMRPTDAVVHHEAGLVQHQAVAAASDAELEPGIGVEPVEELGGIRPDDLDLARASRRRTGRRCGAPVGTRARTAACMSSPRRGEVPRAFPGTDILEGRTLLGRPFVHRRSAHGIEELAARETGEGAEGDGRVGLAEGRQADGRHRPRRAPWRRWARTLRFDVLPWSVAMPVVV